jgi:hypothetical protein
MDIAALIQEATQAGLRLIPEGERLRIRGPKKADAIARRLLDHRAEVLAALCPPAGRMVCNAPESAPAGGHGRRPSLVRNNHRPVSWSHCYQVTR